jgi:2'-5' RNA ligase
MGCHPNGDQSPVHALVIYIPDPLGKFLDELRRELVPGCNPHAHVSVLPPRTLTADWQAAAEQVRECAGSWPPFEIALGEIRIFPVTNVIYLDLASGADEMYRMHGAMSSGALQFPEPFKYHPHVTLAQELRPEDVDDVQIRAQQRWAEYRGPRRFCVEKAAFVKNTSGNCWADLGVFSLNVVPVRVK